MGRTLRDFVDVFGEWRRLSFSRRRLLLCGMIEFVLN